MRELGMAILPDAAQKILSFTPFSIFSLVFLFSISLTLFLTHLNVGMCMFLSMACRLEGEQSASENGTPYIRARSEAV